MMNDASEELEYIADIAAYREHGAMPNGGGRLDQDPRWIQAEAIMQSTIEEVGAAQRRQEALGGKKGAA